MEDIKEKIIELLNETELSNMDRFSLLMEIANDEIISDREKVNF